MGGNNQSSLVMYVAPVIYDTNPGWIVTYIIDIRDGGVSSGYISTGFFGGGSIAFYVGSSNVQKQD